MNTPAENYPARKRAMLHLRSALRPISVVSGWVLFSLGSLHATQTTFTGTGNFTDAGNYSSTVPTANAVNSGLRINLNGTLTYNLADGTTTLDISGAGGDNRGLVIGNTDGTAGTLNITGGELIVTQEGANTSLLLGAPSTSGASTSVVNLNGGSLTVDHSTAGGNSGRASLLFRGGAGANATLNINSGGTFTSEVVFFGEIGVAAGASGTINLNSGGTLVIRNIRSTDPDMNAVMNLNGGTIRLQDNEEFGNAIIDNNLSAVNVMAGGVTFNTDGFTGRVDQPLLNGTGGADGGLTKTGAGILRLSNNSTYNGATAINSGAVRVENNNGLGSTSGATTVATGARLELAGGVTVNENVTINGDGGNAISAGAYQGAVQSQSGVNTWAGNITLGSSNPRLGAQNGSILQVTGSIQDGASSSVIFRSGNSGTVRLSAGQVYTGDTIIYNGSLQLSDDNAIPTGSSLVLGTTGVAGTLDLNGHTQTIAGLSASGTVADQLISNYGGGAGSINVNIASGTDTYNGRFTDTTGNPLSLIKSGAGTLRLTQDHIFRGTVAVNGGVLEIDGAGANMNEATGLTINNGGTFREIAGNDILGNIVVTLNAGGLWQLGKDEQIGILQGAGTLEFTDNSANHFVRFSDNTGQNLEFSGEIRNAVGVTTENGLIKQNNSTLTLSGSSSYTGTTFIQGGTLLVGSGNESSLGTPNANAGALTLDGGTFGIVNSSLTIDDAGRELTLGGFAGTFNVPSGLLLDVRNNINGTNSRLFKVGVGTMSVSESTLTVGNLDLVDGDFTVQNGATLRTDNINFLGGVFNWEDATLTHQTTIAQEGNTNFSSAGFQDVLVGKQLFVNGDLTSSSGSTVALHSSPTLYLNNGVRFNNLVVDGDLDLLASDDVLELQFSPYLLRPVSLLGANATETGSLPLVTWTGTLNGQFDIFTGISNDGRGFSLSAFSVTDPSALLTDTYYLEYDLTDQTIYLHYKVSGYVPEPQTLGLLFLGIGGLKFAAHRKRLAKDKEACGPMKIRIRKRRQRRNPFAPPPTEF